MKAKKKNPSANAGDMGSSIPGPRKPHMLLPTKPTFVWIYILISLGQIQRCIMAEL